MIVLHKSMTKEGDFRIVPVFGIPILMGEGQVLVHRVERMEDGLIVETVTLESKEEYDADN